MNPDSSRIFVAGHRGLVGSAIVRNLQQKGFKQLICRTRAEVDLVNQQQVQQFFKSEKIDYVFLAAGRVGGVHANSTYPAHFLYENFLNVSWN